jgi:hypothetical protein
MTSEAGSVQGLMLIISDADLEETQRNKIIADQRATKVLGGEAHRALVDALPGLVARRIRAIVPDDFRVTEIELSMTIQGTICGSGISGDVKVKLAPPAK